MPTTALESQIPAVGAPVTHPHFAVFLGGSGQRTKLLARTSAAQRERCPAAPHRGCGLGARSRTPRPRARHALRRVFAHDLASAEDGAAASPTNVLSATLDADRGMILSSRQGARGAFAASMFLRV